MADVSTPHDAFFKRLLGSPEAAATFLRERLPAEITATQRSLNEEATRAAVRRALPEQEEWIMSTLAEQWELRGKEKGLAEGLAAGKAAALLQILTHRFGEPSETVRTAVLAADPDTLDVWIERALDAASPDAVLDTRRHG